MGGERVSSGIRPTSICSDYMLQTMARNVSHRQAEPAPTEWVSFIKQEQDPT